MWCVDKIKPKSVIQRVSEQPPERRVAVLRVDEVGHVDVVERHVEEPRGGGGAPCGDKVACEVGVSV